MTTFAGNAQHTAVFNPAAQDLNSDPLVRLDRSEQHRRPGPLRGAPDHRRQHGPRAREDRRRRVPGPGFRRTRAAPRNTRWRPTTSCRPTTGSRRTSPVLAAGPPADRLYYPGAGGTVFFIENPDSARRGLPSGEVFYTSLADYLANAAAFNAAVFVNTPITADSAGNIFFGFRVQGTAPAPLSTTQGGFARIAPDGNATYVLAGAAADDPAIGRDSHNSAPALEQRRDDPLRGREVREHRTPTATCSAWTPSTLATRYRVLLKDPRNGQRQQRRYPGRQHRFAHRRAGR